MDAKHILLIEDDEQFRNYLEEVLKSEGFNVSTAADGQQGYDSAMENKPDLMITDLLMPEKDGVRLITEIKQAYPDLNIIAMSGGQSVFSPAFLEAAQSLGANYTLDKPFMEDQLLELIEKCLS